MSDPQSPTILQRYHLLRKIATGGMAEVYLAEQTGAGGFKKRVAIKRILPAFAEDPKFVEMFLDEARLAAMFHHPNLIQIYELGEVDGLLCMIMEYVRGVSLSELNKRAHTLGQASLAPGLAARILAQACEGLQYAHDFQDPDSGEALGLVHRDVSPQNILISKEGIVKVMDFGIAKAAGQIHHTSTGTLKGKLAYMPPEQLEGKPLDRRADVWALGVVLYELLAGRRPFVGESEAAVFRAVLMDPIQPIEALVPGIPPPLRAVVNGALTREIDRRTPTAGAMAQQLEDWLQGGPRTGPAEVSAWMKPLLPEAGEGGGAGMLTPSNLSKPPSASLSVEPDESALPTTWVPAGTPVDVSMSSSVSGRGDKLRAQPEKRPLSWLAVAAAAAVTVAIGGGVWVWMSEPRPEPRLAPSSQPLAVAPPAPAPKPDPPAPLPPPTVVKPVEPEVTAPTMPGPVARHDKHREPAPRHHGNYEPALPNNPLPPKTITVTRSEDSNPASPKGGDTGGPMGSLVVNTDPWSRVTIDGRDFGQTPLPGVPLKPGPHVLVCTPESGPAHRETVVIPPGERVKRLINLSGGE
jgi:serine/threonine-protein kinase